MTQNKISKFFKINFLGNVFESSESYLFSFLQINSHLTNSSSNYNKNYKKNILNIFHINFRNILRFPPFYLKFLKKYIENFHATIYVILYIYINLIIANYIEILFTLFFSNHFSFFNLNESRKFRD